MPWYKKRQRMIDDDLQQLREELRREVTADVLSNIPSLLASHGLIVVPRSGCSPNESPSDVRRSSFSSIEGGGQRFEYEGHEPMLQFEEQQIQQTADQPPVQKSPVLPNLSAGSISLLQEPTPCALLGQIGGHAMEVARGEVVPDQRVLRNVEVLHGYVVVHIQYVHSAHKDYRLEVAPNDETFTLKDVVHQWVQWRKTSIILHPGPMQGTPGPSPPKPPMPPKKPKTSSPLMKPAQKAEANKAKSDQGSVKSTDNKAKSTSTGSKKSEPKKMSSEWTRNNKNFRFGEPLMQDEELRKAGPNAQRLHRYYTAMTTGRGTLLSLSRLDTLKRMMASSLLTSRTCTIRSILMRWT